jgi:guanylate kinase
MRRLLLKVHLMPEVLIFTGPHGAGKDTVEKSTRANRTDIRRIVRHITRSPAVGEKEGEDYYYVTREQFTAMIDNNLFIEWAEYPDVLSGTMLDEVIKSNPVQRLASLTLNPEDALPLKTSFESSGLPTTIFFVSPVNYKDFVNKPEVYIDLLRQRMENRGRHGEYISNKLSKAAIYRNIYFQTPGMHYVANLDGKLDIAVDHINTILDRGVDS